MGARDAKEIARKLAARGASVRFVAMRWSLAAIVMMVALSACDRSPPPAVVSAPRAKEYLLEIRPVTPLLPERVTHVAVDANGNIYWVQETANGDDMAFAIGEGGVPRATQLASRGERGLLAMLGLGEGS